MAAHSRCWSGKPVRPSLKRHRRKVLHCPCMCSSAVQRHCSERKHVVSSSSCVCFAVCKPNLVHLLYWTENIHKLTWARNQVTNMNSTKQNVNTALDWSSYIFCCMHTESWYSDFKIHGYTFPRANKERGIHFSTQPQTKRRSRWKRRGQGDKVWFSPTLITANHLCNFLKVLQQSETMP